MTFFHSCIAFPAGTLNESSNSWATSVATIVEPSLVGSQLVLRVLLNFEMTFSLHFRHEFYAACMGGSLDFLLFPRLTHWCPLHFDILSANSDRHQSLTVSQRTVRTRNHFSWRPEDLLSLRIYDFYSKSCRLHKPQSSMGEMKKEDIKSWKYSEILK